MASGSTDARAPTRDAELRGPPPRAAQDDQQNDGPIPRSGNTAPSASGANGPQGPPTQTANGRKKTYKIRGTTFSVDPNYDVIKAIGLGAYGLVCSAHDTQRNRYVAIKKIPKVFDDLVDGKRVLRELKIMRYLGEHPNIVRLYEVLRPMEETDAELSSFRDVYVASELMDTDLHLILKSKQKLNFEHHAYFMYQLIRGIAYVHSAGVIHRDLKPANLLLNSSCDLKICDFGLARGGVPLQETRAASFTAIQPHELTDYVITRWYRPPELLLMAPYHHGADMWSVGCIMAEVLLRKALFQGRDYMHQLTIIAEIVDIPTTFEAVQAALPKTGPEQCRYVLRLGTKVLESEKATGQALDTKSRLFARFGLQANKCSNTWNRVMDLICGLLTFDSSQRLSATQALKHPYLAHLYKPQDEYDHRSKLGEPDPHMWDFELHEMGEPELRRLFWEEMMLDSSRDRSATQAPTAAAKDPSTKGEG